MRTKRKVGIVGRLWARLPASWLGVVVACLCAFAFGVGHVLNFSKLIGLSSDQMGEIIARVIAILAWPIGWVAGFI